MIFPDDMNRDELRAWAKAEKLAGYSKLNVGDLRQLVKDELDRRAALVQAQDIAARAVADYDAPAEDDEQVQAQLDEIDAGTFHRTWIEPDGKFDHRPTTLDSRDLIGSLDQLRQEGIIVERIITRARPLMAQAQRVLDGLPPYDPFRPDPQAFINSRTPRRMMDAGHRC